MAILALLEVAPFVLEVHGRAHHAEFLRMYACLKTSFYLSLSLSFSLSSQFL